MLGRDGLVVGVKFFHYSSSVDFYFYFYFFFSQRQRDDKVKRGFAKSTGIPAVSTPKQNLPSPSVSMIGHW